MGFVSSISSRWGWEYNFVGWQAWITAGGVLTCYIVLAYALPWTLQLVLAERQK